MWYDILPVAAIVGTCLGMTNVLVYLSNKYILGNPYKRHFPTFGDHYFYLRDYRISGDKKTPYYQVGLENIPDLDDKEAATILEEKKELLTPKKTI